MKTYSKIIFLILLFSLLIPLFIKAITFENPFENVTFEKLIENIINFIFLVTIAIVPIMIIVAAFYFLTSGGDSEKVRTARKILLFTFIGLFIVLSGKGIVSLIEQIFQGGPPPPPPPACVPNGCNYPSGNCPAGCTVAEDPDCPPCQSGNGCCGIGCNHADDSDCPETCADVGGSCMRPDICTGTLPAGSHTCYLNHFECTAPDGCCCVP